MGERVCGGTCVHVRTVSAVASAGDVHGRMGVGVAVRKSDNSQPLGAEASALSVPADSNGAQSGAGGGSMFEALKAQEEAKDFYIKRVTCTTGVGDENVGVHVLLLVVM